MLGWCSAALSRVHISRGFSSDLPLVSKIQIGRGRGRKSGIVRGRGGPGGIWRGRESDIEGGGTLLIGIAIIYE